MLDEDGGTVVELLLEDDSEHPQEKFTVGPGLCASRSSCGLPGQLGQGPAVALPPRSEAHPPEWTRPLGPACQ